jgi:HSP20 family protein
MSALTRIDPFDQMFPEMFRRFMRPMALEKELPADIRIDVTENDKNFQVRAEIPGAKKDDIRVTVDGNYVSIAAEVRKEKEEKSEGRTLARETYFGSLSRGFSLTSEIDEKNVVAKLEDGILKLTLPKREGAGGRLITVE